MANETFIQTADVETGVATVGEGAQIRNAQYGIDALIPGYIIQSVTVSKTRVYDETYSQKNALVSELDTDEQYSASMTVIGGDGNEDATIPGITVGQTNLSWNGHLWKVRSVEFQGSYNDKKIYQVELFRAKCFPPQS